MGCISSKAMGRSMSIHERFNQGFHALAIGSEDFHLSTRERDRIITLIKIASGKNLRNFRYVDADTDENTKPCTSVEELDENEQNSQASKSTKLPDISNLEPSSANETDTVHQGSARYRSFHTLEEFEELIEKVKRFEARIVEMAEESDPSTTRHSLETCPFSTDGEIVSGDNRDSHDNIQVVAAPKNLDAAAGWKRKGVAKELEPLMLPNLVKAELSSVGSLKEWIHSGDDIYSPETYTTPKFGSYAIDRKEFGMFSPELVAAFEDVMQQMEAEEAGILKQMEESFAC